MCVCIVQNEPSVSGFRVRVRVRIRVRVTRVFSSRRSLQIEGNVSAVCHGRGTSATASQPLKSAYKRGPSVYACCTCLSLIF